MADRFMKGTLILTAAGLLVKILGSVNRILLSRMLGGEGIGLYQIAYPLYLFMVALSSAGVPAAMSILIARRAALKDREGARRTLRVCTALMVGAGAAFALLALFAVPLLIKNGLVRDARAEYAMLALVPAIGLSIPVSCFRGYFQGFQEMTPTAVSQIGEQFVRVMVMLLLAWALLPQGLPLAAAGAAFGSVPGALASLLLLLYFYARQQRKWQLSPAACSCHSDSFSAAAAAKALIVLALPVTCANLMVPAVNMVEIILVPNRLLAAGFTVAESTRALGYLAGMAMPLVNMGTIPTNSLASSVVPAVSEAKALGDRRTLERKNLQAFRFFLLLNLPAAVGVWLLGSLISRVLYGTVHAGPVISALAPAIFFLGLHQVSTALLQGLGHTRVPMVNMLLSILLKIALLWVLAADPRYHILGAAWATDLNLAFAGGANLIYLAAHEHLLLPGKHLLRIGFSAAVMGAAVRWAAAAVSGHPAWQMAELAALGAAVYGLCLIVAGELDLRRLRPAARKKS